MPNTQPKLANLRRRRLWSARSTYPTAELSLDAALVLYENHLQDLTPHENPEAHPCPSRPFDPGPEVLGFQPVLLAHPVD